MPKRQDYRPRGVSNETKAEMLRLRGELGKCREMEWVKAGNILQEIGRLRGFTHGPMSGRIIPRACRFCKHYGHNRKWCPVREQYEIAAMERFVKEDKALEARLCTIEAPKVYEESPQAITFRKLGLKYRIDPDLGPILA